MFQPQFTITADIAAALMSIEGDRQAVAQLPVDVAMLASLRETAKLMATHYSTQIEGNRLTAQEVAQALEGHRLPGRQRDQLEVRNYYQALCEMEKLAASPRPITEEDIQRLHALIVDGSASPKPYRDGQNVIRDSVSGGIVYMPPEAQDVPELIKELLEWLNGEIVGGKLPAPLAAGLAHYQYATIHPYYDGNGRTARLLATLILHRTGYGLKGIFALEEYYARRLPEYYAALTVGPSPNYYVGRAQADITAFLAYFCQGMAESFRAVRAQALAAKSRGERDLAPDLRKMDPRERRVLEFFARGPFATAAEIADFLGLSERTTRELCRKWVTSGFLRMHDPSRKRRIYAIGENFEQMISQQQRDD